MDQHVPGGRVNRLCMTRQAAPSGASRFCCARPRLTSKVRQVLCRGARKRVIHTRRTGSSGNMLVPPPRTRGRAAACWRARLVPSRGDGRSPAGLTPAIAAGPSRGRKPCAMKRCCRWRWWWRSRPSPTVRQRRLARTWSPAAASSPARPARNPVGVRGPRGPGRRGRAPGAGRRGRGGRRPAARLDRLRGGGPSDGHGPARRPRRAEHHAARAGGELPGLDGRRQGRGGLSAGPYVRACPRRRSRRRDRPLRRRFAASHRRRAGQRAGPPVAAHVRVGGRRSVGGERFGG